MTSRSRRIVPALALAALITVCARAQGPAAAELRHAVDAAASGRAPAASAYALTPDELARRDAMVADLADTKERYSLLAQMLKLSEHYTQTQQQMQGFENALRQAHGLPESAVYDEATHSLVAPPAPPAAAHPK